MNEQEHLLTYLSEECGEVSKEIHKALRFGLHDRYPDSSASPSVREKIIAELNDLMGVIKVLEDQAVLPSDWSSKEKQDAKIKKVSEYVGYARKLGHLVSGQKSEASDPESTAAGNVEEIEKKEADDGMSLRTYDVESISNGLTVTWSSGLKTFYENIDKMMEPFTQDLKQWAREMSRHKWSGKFRVHLGFNVKKQEQ